MSDHDQDIYPVPAEWAEKLCALLPALVEEARSLNDVPAQF